MAVPSAFQKQVQNCLLILAMNLLQIEPTWSYSVNLYIYWERTDQTTENYSAHLALR